MEKNAYIYRAYIAQKKYRVVLDEIEENVMPELAPIRTLAEYFAFPEKRAQIIEAIEQKIEITDSDELGTYFILAAANIFYCEENFGAALKLLHKQNDLESMSLSLQCLLKLNRYDLAWTMTSQMQKLYDDATLAQLGLAWLNVAIGGEKISESFDIYQELIDKFTASVYLLNGQAVCCLGSGKYEEAEKLLREALDKDSNNYDTLVNSVTLAYLTGKSGAGKRYIGQIEELYPKSGFVEDMVVQRNEFNRLSLNYRPSVEAAE